jgi:cytochrome bd-type quinol oxidase subunit 2
MKKSNYINASILVSLISILVTAFINYQIAKEYLRVSGKTRALFGIKEVFQFPYQYYVIVFGFTSLILAILSRKDKGQKIKYFTAFVLSLFAISIIFLRIWRLFI